MNEHKLTLPDVESYARALVQAERAAGTVEKYRRDLIEFMAWLSQRPVSPETAVGWRDHLLAAGLAPVTVNAKLSALNGFFKSMGWEECRVKFLRLQRRMFREPARELTRSEYERLLKTARAQGKNRLRLLMETICSTGIRVSEVRHITVEAARQGQADVTLKGKIRTILLPDRLCKKLLKYAAAQKTASGAIFRTRSGNQLSRRQIWREMKNLCREARVAASKVFPHNLRHLFAVVFFQANRDIVKLAGVLGHSSIETTRIYLLTSGTEHRRLLERLRLVT